MMTERQHACGFDGLDLGRKGPSDSFEIGAVQRCHVPDLGCRRKWFGILVHLDLGIFATGDLVSARSSGNLLD